ncbi:MAG TPA: DPP IV N-terminal domain-containing protein [Spirochaetota bacterium]|nr:DPP IV N-terminal domain-containing protein [Spirochaetota bacterium]HRZ28460.1 DPP IV N-terminal domain-containing protein [Spirochaetota bacterium]
MKRFKSAVFILLIISFYIACDEGGDGGNKLEAPAALSSAPTITSAPGQLTATWTAVSRATAYEVWYATSDDSGAATLYVDDVAVTGCLITGLTNGTPYYIWVKAKNSAGTSGFSPSGTGTPESSSLTNDLLFAHLDGSGDPEILRMHDSTTDTVVAAVSGTLLADVTCSRDRTKTAYLEFDDDGDFIMFKDSGTTIDITPTNFDFSGDFSMALSPDGSKLAYVDDNWSNYHICVISTASANPTYLELTDCAGGMDKYPTWSPDGTEVAFVHIDEDYNAKIYSVKADGTSDDAYGNELFSFDTVVALNESLIQISWSPVNEYQMACSARINSGTGFFIYMLNISKKERTKITSNSTTGSELFPVWSEDGNFIYFEMNDNIYYNPVDSSEDAATPVTTDGESNFRGWEPS